MFGSNVLENCLPLPKIGNSGIVVYRRQEHIAISCTKSVAATSLIYTETKTFQKVFDRNQNFKIRCTTFFSFVVGLVVKQNLDFFLLLHTTHCLFLFYLIAYIIYLPSTTNGCGGQNVEQNLEQVWLNKV